MEGGRSEGTERSMERNEEVWEQTFSLNTHAVEIDYADEPEKGFLTLKKASSDEAFSKRE